MLALYLHYQQRIKQQLKKLNIMKFSIEVAKTNNLIASMGSFIDTDSVSITIFTKDFSTRVASGTLNLKSNWAHLEVEVEDEDGELEDYLVDAIEGRKILFK